MLVVLPISIPDFIVGYAWHSWSPGFIGLRAAAVVMTLDLYPLVYLPVSAALRRTDPTLEETSQALGCGPWTTFRRVVFPQIRGALMGGMLVVALALLAEFGAFEILSFRTFTTEIFTELRIDQSAASAMALLLVALGIVVLLGEAYGSGRGRAVRSGAHASRPPVRRHLGPWTIPVLLGLLAWSSRPSGCPSGRWPTGSPTRSRRRCPPAPPCWPRRSRPRSTPPPPPWSPPSPRSRSALLAAQRRGRLARVLVGSTFLVQSVPGVVIALSLVFFAVRYAFALYQSSTLWCSPTRCCSSRSRWSACGPPPQQAPPRLAEMGRSLGYGPVMVFLRVTLPLILPGVIASWCLVFLSSVTELTATLVLVPTDVQTLATQFWAYQTNTVLRRGRAVRAGDPAPGGGAEPPGGRLVRPPAASVGRRDGADVTSAG